MIPRKLFFTMCRFCATNSAAMPLHSPLGIEMVPEVLRRYLFASESQMSVSSEGVEEWKEHLVKLLKINSDQLAAPTKSAFDEIDYQLCRQFLPPLLGADLNAHFAEIAQNQISPYLDILQNLVVSKLPPMPQKWAFGPGWTKYTATGRFETVDFPADDGLIFDVEVCLSEGPKPVLAVAASPSAWYAWCSDRLVDELGTLPEGEKDVQINDLIPLEAPNNQPISGEHLRKPRLVIGHHVGFDRTFIKEQYYFQPSKLRFVDTMALHISVCGLATDQRILFKATQKGRMQTKAVKDVQRYSASVDNNWMDSTSMNALDNVFHHHCPESNTQLDKQIRNLFVEGSITDIRKDFQNLMTYCATDVLATFEVLQKLWPEFQERFPHPVTLAGMLEMGTAFLPINSNWNRYISQCEQATSTLEQEVNQLLCGLANSALECLKDDAYTQDAWLWDLDWSKSPSLTKRNINLPRRIDETLAQYRQRVLVETGQDLPKRPGVFVGFPAWYRVFSETDATEGPVLSSLTPRLQVSPKLLRLSWNGFPVFHSRLHGWGYLVPNRADNLDQFEPNLTAKGHWVTIATGPKTNLTASLPSEEILKVAMDFHGAKYNEVLEEHDRYMSEGKNGFRSDVVLPGCSFWKLPHPAGFDHNVGSPLTKDFYSYIERGILQSAEPEQAQMVVKHGAKMSYWKNNSDRIRSQKAIWWREEDFTTKMHQAVGSRREDFRYGAILPKIVTSGTVTRRSVENTWMTASNAYPDRIGSELKAMIQAPPGYHIVGADVDSQELWIASVLGDSASRLKTHGSTPFSWMLLRGSKQEGTDLHTVVAKTMGISRDHAKVMNYARIYGAGAPFASRLLGQFNPNLTPEQAKRTVYKLFEMTKGRMAYALNDHGLHAFSQFKGANLASKEPIVTPKVMKSLSKIARAPATELGARKWTKGIESDVFNALEAVATSRQPATPVLGARISKALEPQNVDTDFLPSRMNWVVQSSAVDYLHLMICCLSWLCEVYEVDARFMISVHDEVRYLVPSSERYFFALLLQLTNLLTRSMFVDQLGMPDLPVSVAFFSSVDVDTVWRKEPTLECNTPSNLGGLAKDYGIPPGEALSISKILTLTQENVKKRLEAKNVT